MKKGILNFALVLILFGFLSCSDCPESPYQTGGTFKSNRKVLVEDFTGYKCTNCPPAAEEAESIDSLYGENVIVVAIHCTSQFAEPDPDAQPGDLFYEDFRTVAGEEYVGAFGINSLPNGMVNRTKFDNNVAISFTNWSSAVNLDLDKENKIGLKFTTVTFDSTNRKLNVAVEAEAQSAELSGSEYRFTLYFVEDGLIAAQKYPAELIDGTLVEIVDTNHIFNHVLRGTLGDTWGEIAYQGTIEDGEIKVLNYQYTVPEKWNIKNSGLVGYIYKNTESANEREILQVEEFKFKDIE